MNSSNAHIESVPGKCGGKPVVAGSRIRVWDIYCHHELYGRSAVDILMLYPELKLAEVYAALTYYYDHKQQIDAQMQAEDRYADELKASLGPGPLAEKGSNLKSGGDSISS